MACIATLFTDSEASPWISILLVSGGELAALVFGACGLGPPQADKSKMTATTDHTLMRMGNISGEDQNWLGKC